MIIRPATIMRNDYNLISEYAHQSGEIVYLTKYGKGDLVVMSIKTFEQREEKFKFYHTVMQADLDRQKSAEELFDGDDAIARLKAKFIDWLCNTYRIEDITAGMARSFGNWVCLQQTG